MPRARRSKSNPPVFREPPNKQSVQQRTATAGVSSRVLVARQENLFFADPKDLLAPSDRVSSASSSASTRGSGGSATLTATATGRPTLKPTSKRIGPLSASSAAGLASAACLAAWWLDCFDSRASVSLPLVCGLAGGCYALFAEEDSTQEQQQEQEEPEREPMWTLTQFDHFGALRFDNYLRFLVTKLAVVWRAIAALHKTATNYRFTVSISDKPSLSELQDLLEGRVPLLLTYDDVKQQHHGSPHGSDSDDHGKFSRSRVSSRASTAVTDDSSYYRESMDLSGLDMDMMRASFLEEPDKLEKPVQKTEFQALEDQDDVTEYFTIEDTTDEGGWPSESESEASAVATEEDAAEQEDAKPTSPKHYNATIAKALRSILVPVLPVEELATEIQNRHATPSPSQLPGEPVVVPSVKPLIQDAKQADWHTKPARQEAAGLDARARQPALKRQISINVTSMKPLPRLVVKARPSTLTPPQNVQRMLDQVEKMMREVHELLAAGRDVLRSVETPGSAETEKQEDEKKKEEKKATGVSRPVKKAVSFSDDVCVLDATVSGLAAEEERELRTSLSYGPDEIESMSNDFFAELSLPSFD